jgi:hypothetical protein
LGSIPIARSITPVDAGGLLAFLPEIDRWNTRFWVQLQRESARDETNRTRRFCVLFGSASCLLTEVPPSSAVLIFSPLML